MLLDILNTFTKPILDFSVTDLAVAWLGLVVIGLVIRLVNKVRGK